MDPNHNMWCCALLLCNCVHDFEILVLFVYFLRQNQKNYDFFFKSPLTKSFNYVMEVHGTKPPRGDFRTHMQLIT
jgi:hypothetical protein